MEIIFQDKWEISIKGVASVSDITFEGQLNVFLAWEMVFDYRNVLCKIYVDLCFEFCFKKIFVQFLTVFCQKKVSIVFQKWRNANLF